MASSSNVFTDLYLSDDDEQTTSTNNLLNVVHGDTDTYTATGNLPNFHLIMGKETGSSNSGVKPTKKRSKAAKKCEKQTSKSTTVKLDKRSMRTPASQSTEIQAMQTTHVTTEAKTFENLYTKNKLHYSLISSCIGSIDNVIRECDEFTKQENLMTQNGVQLCKIKSREPKEQLVELKKYYTHLAQDCAPEICLVCKSDTPSVIGSCGHCFICFKCYVPYLNKVLAKNITSTSCLKCGNIVNTTILSA